MKFVRVQKGIAGPDSFVFQLNKQEMDWLVAILRFFPQRESPCHPITRGDSTKIKTCQTLLKDAMEQHRDEHQRKLDKFLASNDRFRPEGPDLFRLVLAADQLEWMLQILNDVRVGCWMKLGCPELEPLTKRKLTAEEARWVSALELSGFFQMVLLGACDGPEAAV